MCLSNVSVIYFTSGPAFQKFYLFSVDLLSPFHPFPFELMFLMLCTINWVS